MTVFRPPVRRLLIFFLIPVLALTLFIAFAEMPIAVRALGAVLDVAGIALLVRGLALRIEVGNGYVTVRGPRATKRFDADKSRVRTQVNSAGVGGEAFQLVIKRDDGHLATYIPMILFAPHQIRPVVDAVCTALGV